MMKYRAFFSIETDHQYFTTGGSPDLTLVPDKASQKYLSGRHFIVKATPKGLKVLVPINENGTVKPIFEPDQVLTFDVFPNSAAFGSITDTTELNQGEVFHFTNRELPVGTAELQSSGTSATDSLNGYAIVAKIEILLTESLFTNSDPVQYKISFKAKSAKWKYFFVSDQGTTDLAVEDRDQNLVFNPVVLDEQSQEAVGISLRLNFPDSSLFLFESNASITCSDQVVKNLQLLRDGHVIIKHLPNPETGSAPIKIIKI